jgi:magnesium transporter
VCSKTVEYFRDVHDHLVRIGTSIDAMRETIGTAIQVNLSAVTIEESETTKRLAAWAGIFGVATAFAGIWGMNFQYMPELQWTHGYPVAVALMALIDVYLFYRFRKANWL